MFKGIIGRFRFNKNKRLLEESHDITLDELNMLLQQHEYMWINWVYKPTKSGNLEISMFHKTLDRFDDAYTLLYNKLGEGKYVSNDSTRITSTILLDDWLSDGEGVPLNISDYLAHLTDSMKNVSLMLDRISEKKICFYHRNSYFLRKDMQTLLRTISKI